MLLLLQIGLDCLISIKDCDLQRCLTDYDSVSESCVIVSGRSRLMHWLRLFTAPTPIDGAYMSVQEVPSSDPLQDYSTEKRQLLAALLENVSGFQNTTNNSYATLDWYLSVCIYI